MKMQIAFEYIIMVMIVLGFLIPVWIYVSQSGHTMSDQFSLSYARDSISKIAESADLVYSQRLNASVKIKIYIPPGVQQANVTGHYIGLRIIYQGELNDVSSTTNALVNGTIPTQEGTYYIFIEAKGDYVQITPLYT